MRPPGSAEAGDGWRSHDDGHGGCAAMSWRRRSRANHAASRAGAASVTVQGARRFRMRTVRAAVVNAVRDAVRVEPLSLREPRADEVLVRLGASGVCHSDLHVITGDLPMPLPAVLGHRGAGVLEEVCAP